MAGHGAIAACEEAVLREAAQLEASLVRSGALAGIQHKFVDRRGELWPELQEIIRQESADLLIVGTLGRQGVAKLFFGSAAEHILRQASCPVLVFGPTLETALLDRKSLKTSDISLCNRFRTSFSPGTTPCHCGCESLRSRARFSECRPSHSSPAWPAC